MAPAQLMHAVIDGKPAAPLTAEQERCIRPSRPEKVAAGVMLSPDDATAAYISQTKWLFFIMGGLCLFVTSGVALLAEPSDRALTFGGAVVANLALAAFLFIVLQRRTAIWRSKLGLRMIGLMPAGSQAGFDSGLRIGDRVLPWASLSIDQVELAEFTSQRTTVYTIERLLVDEPSRPHCPRPRHDAERAADR